MDKEKFEHRKEFAKELAERFTAEEISMILWQYQCCVCSFRFGHNCNGDLDCALGMIITGIERLKRLKVEKLKENNKTCEQCKYYECFDRKEFPCIDCMLDCKDRFEPKGDKA